MNSIALALIGFAGPWEWVIILVIVLIVFGPGKLPSIGKALGEGLRSFKKATSDDEIDVTPAHKTDQLEEGHADRVDPHARSDAHSKA